MYLFKKIKKTIWKIFQMKKTSYSSFIFFMKNEYRQKIKNKTFHKNDFPASHLEKVPNL